MWFTLFCKHRRLVHDVPIFESNWLEKIVFIAKSYPQPQPKAFRFVSLLPHVEKNMKKKKNVFSRCANESACGVKHA